jgi:hypothetical protein
MKNFFHPLMENNIDDGDIKALQSFIKKNKIIFLLNLIKLKNLRLNGQNGLELNIVYLLTRVHQQII